MSENGFTTGAVVNQFEVLTELGRGGMGVVYKAMDTGLQRPVALKVLPHHLSSDPTFRERFAREAQACAKLSHPHIVTVYAIGDHDGHEYIAMEYVSGKTLATVIRERGRLQLHQALELTLQIAGALAVAHRHDIIHRDVNPQNIMVDDRGVAKIMDFGLAKVLHGAAPDVTRDGSTLGTPRYMSPEQCESLPVDHRTDIYSLGVVLYEMLTGHVPYQAESLHALMREIVEEPLPSLQELNQTIPVAVEDILKRMTAKAPASRYTNADALAADIRHFLSEEGLETPTSEKPTAVMHTPLRPFPIRRRIRSLRLPTPVLAVLFALLGAGGAIVAAFTLGWIPASPYNTASGRAVGSLASTDGADPVQRTLNDIESRFAAANARLADARDELTRRRAREEDGRVTLAQLVVERELAERAVEEAEAALKTLEDSLEESRSMLTEAADPGVVASTTKLDGKWVWVDNEAQPIFELKQSESGAIDSTLFDEGPVEVVTESLLYEDRELQGTLVTRGEDPTAANKPLNRQFRLAMSEDGARLAGKLFRWSDGEDEREEVDVVWQRIDAADPEIPPAS